MADKTKREKIAELKAEVAALRLIVAQLQATMSGHIMHPWPSTRDIFTPTPSPLPWQPNVVTTPKWVCDNTKMYNDGPFPAAPNL